MLHVGLAPKKLYTESRIVSRVMAKYKLHDAIHIEYATVLVDISVSPDRLALYVNENARRA